jgi:hypothetical protein
MVKRDERKRSFGRIACERSGVEEIRRGQQVLETDRLTGKRGGFGGEQVERSCVEQNVADEDKVELIDRSKGMFFFFLGGGHLD